MSKEAKDAEQLQEDKPKKGKKIEEVEFVKSKRRTSFDEYILINSIRPEIAAGFKVWLKGELFHTDGEWNKIFEDYKNRG